jgi:PAS domain S-box-containing protein
MSAESKGRGGPGGADKEAAYETILDSIADGVFTVDGRWRITSFNKAAEHITGFSKAEAIGRCCYDIFRASVCQTSCVLRRTMETGVELINIPVNIVTADGVEKPISVSTAVLRDRRGTIRGGVETFRDLSAIERLRRALAKEYSFQDIISKNHRMQELFSILPDVAESDSTVLIQGPSGSGKELFARAIHNLSQRRVGPFVAVNCAALPDTLLESELFGYKRGAFTDARRDKPGRFDAAQGGTVFLDEVGDISLPLQVKLLRVLQERTYEPLGSAQPVRVDARIIAATNKDLRAQMGLGRFRDDLYYRLNVIRLDIPPLSERPEDIPLLVDHIVARLNAEKGRNILGVTPDAMEVLLDYAYPGNVRELENVLERAFILCRGDMIDLACLPSEMVPDRGTGAEGPAGIENPLKAAEAKTILQALARNNGHRERTAKALGIHKTTLIRKMKSLSITYP